MVNKNTIAPARYAWVLFSFKLYYITNFTVKGVAERIKSFGATYEREEYNSVLISEKYTVIDTPIVAIGRELFGENEKRKTLYELLEILCDNYADKTASR